MSPKRSLLLTSLLSVDNVDGSNVYRSPGPHLGGVIGPNRLFGGYVAAQCYEAVRQYMKSKNSKEKIFSMHYNFVSAGSPEKPIDIKIHQEDSIYAVGVYHDAKNIGMGHVKTDSKLMEAPIYPSDVPGLTDIIDVYTILALAPPAQQEFYEKMMENFIFELRPYHMVTNPGPNDYRVIFYARIMPDCIAHMQEDGGMVAVVTLSDLFILQSVKNAINQSGLRMATGASLHHKIYFHQERVEAIQWFLVETRTEIATRNKAKIFGSVFDSNKDCVVSFIQEAYVVPQERSSKL